MDERVKKYLEKHNEDEIRKKRLTKEQTLIRIGLCERVYSPDGKSSKEYPICDYIGGGRYYKNVAFDITDEDYEEILKVTTVDDVPTKSKNVVSKILLVIAIIIYILGLIFGIAIVSIDEDAFWLTLIYWFSAFISGTMFLGFSEIIKLLHKINNK